MGWVAPLSACGPFLYENAELDRFSLVDPGILNNPEWVTFLAFDSPALGLPEPQGSGSEAVQKVLHPGRLADPLYAGVSNLLYDYAPGEDPVSVAANEAWWVDYFATVRHRKVSAEELQAVLYGPDRPGWLEGADRAYLRALDGPADDPQVLATALVSARNSKLPEPLRHRWAFWAVRALALGHDPAAVERFREFCPGRADDLPLARAQGWAAQVRAADDPQGALAWWLDLFVRWPALRTQTFSSLSTYSSDEFRQQGTAAALVAGFFLDGRDFSPETLGTLARAEKASGGDGSWTESVFFAMAEQVEREAGVFALFGLVDPQEVSPLGLFTGLIDGAQSLVETGVQPPTRTWWLVAAYLCLFDGDPARAAALLDRAQALPARNGFQTRQTDLLETLVKMAAERDRDWSPALQNQVVAALDWGQSLNAPGHNRGLYHSVAVLAAQKALARGQNPQAVLAFAVVRTGPWANPYEVAVDDGFWTLGWTPNNPVNLLMDALMTDEDIDTWRALLKARPSDLGPLTARLVSRPFLTDRDLIWWQAHRALRRGQPDRALALLRTLGGDGSTDSGFFPARQFSYSVDLDPLNPGSGRSMRTVGPLTLAGVMARVETEARTRPTSRNLLAQGEFWFSLQLSGLPLLFAQPPQVISFVNGNFEYYGYDGRDIQRTTSVVGTFPLGRPARTDEWTRRLSSFYRDEFSTLGRARAAFEAVVARHDDPDAEFRALLFLAALGDDKTRDLGDPRFASLPLAETYRTTCEAWNGGLL